MPNERGERITIRTFDVALPIMCGESAEETRDRLLAILTSSSGLRLPAIGVSDCTRETSVLPVAFKTIRDEIQ